MTPRPYDALFKLAFETPAAAAALLRELLPAPIRDVVAWEALESEPASFVDPELADLHNDLLFSTRVRGDDDAMIYLLLEHQSSDDAAMPLRILSYENRIWDRIRKQEPGAPLPLVIAVVVNHVPGGWTASRQLADMFAPAVRAIPDLAALIPRFSLFIVDLDRFSNEDLKARPLGAFQQLALWLLRDGRDSSRLLHSFDFWIDTMMQFERSPIADPAFATLIKYMFRVIDPPYRKALRAKISLLGRRAKELTMSIADQIHEEGRKQGLKQGRKQGHQRGLKQGHQRGLKQGHQRGLKQGHQRGLKQGLKQGDQQGRIDVLRRLFLLKFRALDARHEARLLAATPAAIDRYLQRVLTADSVAGVFED
jgi:hypothetical protein